MSGPLIGVLGGMGPAATLDLLQKILQSTPAARDQDHVPVVTWNVPQIPDRQKAMAGTGPSPVPAMLDGIRALNTAGATHIVIPCNTAHRWFDELQAASAAPIVHIADATLALLQQAPGLRKVGLLATRVTSEAGFFQSRFAAHGIECLVTSDAEQDALFTPGCYAVKRNALDDGGKLLEAAAQALIDRGAERLVLACTEVPVGLQHIASPLAARSIDPTMALALSCVRIWQEGRRT
ncbi:aspartate/glutamate racemase family protein [Oxalobacteraceae bacterium OM1]|nr:aspartate/glutamate racemase family protein [Oxalobacteraceae bacterium OM1]